MRNSASWQSVWDDRILEVASEDSDGVVSVGELTDHDLVRTAQSNVSKRCDKLAENGLLRRVGSGVYMITEEGKGYLNEEYDAKRGMWVDRDQAEGEGPSTEATGENGV